MSTTNEFLSALHGKRGDLNAWLVSRDEKEVREAIMALVSPQETLRDKFAAKAMEGSLSNNTFQDADNEELSKWAYEMADAMLKAREVKP